MSDVVRLMKVARYKLNKELLKNRCFRSVSIEEWDEVLILNLIYKGAFSVPCNIMIELEIPYDVDYVSPVSGCKYDENSSYKCVVTSSILERELREFGHYRLSDVMSLTDAVYRCINESFKSIPPSCEYISLNDNVVPLIDYLILSGVEITNVHQFEIIRDGDAESVHNNSFSRDVISMITASYNDVEITLTHHQVFGYTSEMIILYKCRGRIQSSYKVGIDFSERDFRSIYDFVDIMTRDARRGEDA